MWTDQKARIFAETKNGVPDGFRLDVERNVWTSTGGGPKNNCLFITATTSLSAIHIGTRGAK